MSSKIDCDVLIVGSGPSGAVFAKRAHDAGLSVVCLEQGDWVDYGKAVSDKPEFELTASRDWNYVSSRRNNPGDFPIDVDQSDIIPLYWNGVGGSSISWAANWMRNLPSDFRVRTLDGVADDWPISYDDLMPHYASTEREFAVSGVGGDPMYPGQDALLPPVDLAAHLAPATPAAPDLRVVAASVVGHLLLLALVAAYAGLDRVMELYQIAIANRMRFYSYGDAMFLTREALR